MTPNELDLLTAIHTLLERMDGNLRLMLEASKPGPEHQRHISEYAEFDWDSIGAEVIEEDEWGATCVKWGGKVWKRRSPDNKYGVDIWFSRCTHKEDNENVYATLIMFSDKEVSFKVDPLGRNALEALKKHGVKPRSQRIREARAPKPEPAPPPPPPPPPAPQAAPKTEPPATQQVEQQAEPPAPAQPSAQSNVPPNVRKKAELLVAMKAVIPDVANGCYKVGVLPNPVYTVEMVGDRIVCDCDDLAEAAERDPDANCAHIEAVTLFKEARQAQLRQKQGTRPAPSTSTQRATK